MSALSAGMLTLGLLAVMWVLEVFDQATGGWLDQFGIHAREFSGLPEILDAWLLHGGFAHLLGNSLPFAVLGFLVALGGFVRWLAATAISVLTSGISAWLLTPINTIVIGASGLIMGWLTYLIARGIFDRRPKQIVVSVVVLIFYGGMIFNIFPTGLGISWQAHLGGAVGGVLAAWWLHKRSLQTQHR
jgi:membrane associated rhomboid family serine protease